MSKKQLIQVASGLFLILFSPSVHADNMSGLVFLVFIWPVGILVMAILSALLIFSSKLNTGNLKSNKSSYGYFMIAISALVGFGYSLFALTFGAAPANNDWILWAITLLPVILLSAICMIAGHKNLKR